MKQATTLTVDERFPSFLVPPASGLQFGTVSDEDQAFKRDELYAVYVSMHRAIHFTPHADPWGLQFATVSDEDQAFKLTEAEGAYLAVYEAIPKRYQGLFYFAQPWISAFLSLFREPSHFMPASTFQIEYELVVPVPPLKSRNIELHIVSRSVGLPNPILDGED